MTGPGAQDLLERAAESAAMTAAAHAAAGGQGSLLVFEGEAGIGKTRLLLEARAISADAGFRIARARASELERDLAFGVTRQLFEPLLRAGCDAGPDSPWEGSAAQAREVFTAADPAAPVGDFAVLHGLFWLTVNVGHDRPLALLIDDLQWCDTQSLEFLVYLLARIDELPLLIVATMRTGETVAAEPLLRQIATDPSAKVYRPKPLSDRAVTQLLRHELSSDVHREFALACHQATGGNPLLLRELARTLTEEEFTASAVDAGKVADLEPRAISRIVRTRLARVPLESVSLAKAVAILGDRADLAIAARLAGQEFTTALESTAPLERTGFIGTEQTDSRVRLTFTHPLVRTAVYNMMTLAERAGAHRRAAELMSAAGSDPERVAAHLLRTPPAHDAAVVEALRSAAASARAHGAPAGAYTYLRRALDESSAGEERLALLSEAGQAALLVDLGVAVSLLRQAYESASLPRLKAMIGYSLGAALLYTVRTSEAKKILMESAELTPKSETELLRHIQSYILNIPVVESGRHEDIEKLLTDLRRLPPEGRVGSRLLDCIIAYHDMMRSDPRAGSRALRGLSDGVLVRHANGESPMVCGWITLLAAEKPQVSTSLEAAIKQAHRHGSLRDATVASLFRGADYLQQGFLDDAVVMLREAVRTGKSANAVIALPIARSYLAEALLEQGSAQEAASVLTEEDANEKALAPAYFFARTQSPVLLHTGDAQHAFESAVACGRCCEGFGITNPSLVPWRSDAVWSLHVLGRGEEARAYAGEELELARRWGSPRALGRALRSMATATPKEGMEFLEEAVEVLKQSNANLEKAKALAEYGAALRRAGRRQASRKPLHEALDLASRCGALPLVKRVRAELAAAGGQPRRTAVTGPESLTPSERRVAELAAEGATNRHIAQTLFVTPKTIELHLSNVYRKLGNVTRGELSEALAVPARRRAPH
ncbi:AAA family ATPase [Streptomyces sp. NPDC004542]|uniref:helix-turn-helix transcriptional regulator n=1 Tax=Streptomyces sp. NPDC004542 TaxID=3154281 RepID=UPI0033B5E8B5